MIDGVIIKKLKTNNDDRGFFREIIRVTDDFFKEGFGQFSHSSMKKGVLKAWHIHYKQVDWWYVARGLMRVGLYDKRPGSPTFKQSVELLMGDGQDIQVLKIPAGVAHGCLVLEGPCDLFYLTSSVYDPEDEGRIDPNDPEIGFDWINTKGNKGK
jgi:dTDP-4-dehydrorhamnose 3,5-epimerase